MFERILSDATTLLLNGDLPIAEYILNNLDERGYLEVTLEAIADLVKRPVEDIERILRAIQQVAPVGVAARDVRECLLLQLSYLAQQQEKEVPAAVWRIVPAAVVLAVGGAALAAPVVITLEGGAEGDTNVQRVETGPGLDTERVAAGVLRVGGKLDKRARLWGGGYQLIASALARTVVDPVASTENAAWSRPGE